MKKFLFILIAAIYASCSHGAGKVNPDSSNVITDSSALINADTTTASSADQPTKGE
jgi:hypothetical protein